jgi:hypothetical protein
MYVFREYAKDKKMRFRPTIISHHMLMGLKEGQEKMSKSDPDSAIFMEDAAADVSDCYPLTHTYLPYYSLMRHITLFNLPPLTNVISHGISIYR